MLPRPSSSLSAFAQASAQPALATLVYRSRCVTPLDGPALNQLVEAAFQRNLAESVTGLLIYDGGRFLQWLEGPAESVDRIWQSIRVDSRHTDVEILGHMPTTVRCFPDWGMKLGDRDPSERPDAANDAHMRPPHNLIELLHFQEEILKRPLAGLLDRDPLLASLILLNNAGINGANESDLQKQAANEDYNPLVLAGLSQ